MDSGYDMPFNVSPRDVISNAGQSQPQRTAYSAQQQQMMAAGQDPLAMLAPYYAGGAARMDAGQRTAEQAEAKREANPFFRDAQFYANGIGDLGAAQSLMATKNGSAAFQMFENYDFDLGAGDPKDPNQPSGMLRFRVAPRGSRQITTPDGQTADIPVWDLARRSGVSTVAWKGGDESAEKFRNMVAKAQGMFKSLAELEDIYNKNSILTGFGPSEAAAKARGLEGKLLMDYGQVMNEAKSLGAGFSDAEGAIIQSLTPHRASSWFTRLGGNEKALLKQVRQQVLNKIQDSARINGIDLLHENVGQAKQLNQSRLLNSSKSFD